MSAGFCNFNSATASVTSCYLFPDNTLFFHGLQRTYQQVVLYLQAIPRTSTALADETTMYSDGTCTIYGV